jgi:hypothetical protein
LLGINTNTNCKISYFPECGYSLFSTCAGEWELSSTCAGEWELSSTCAGEWVLSSTCAGEWEDSTRKGEWDFSAALIPVGFLKLGLKVLGVLLDLIEGAFEGFPVEGFLERSENARVKTRRTIRIWKSIIENFVSEKNTVTKLSLITKYRTVVSLPIRRNKCSLKMAMLRTH